MEPVLLVSYVALWVLVAFQGLLLLGVVRAISQLSKSASRIGGAPARLGAGRPLPGALTGRPVPRFTAVDTAGQLLDSSTYDGQRRLMVFVAPSCPLCEALIAELEALGAEHQATVVLACVARAEPCRQFSERHGFTRPLLVDGEAALAGLFGISMTPTAVLVEPDDVVGWYRYLGGSDDPSQAFHHLLAQLSSLPHSPPDKQAVTQE